MVTFLLPVLLLTGSLAVEFGHHSVVTADLQDAVDAAARAASFAGSTKDGDLEKIAKSVLAENGFTDKKSNGVTVLVERGRWDPDTSSFQAINDPDRESEKNALRIYARQDVDALMTGMIGVASYLSEAEAIVIRPGVVVAVADGENYANNDRAMIDCLDAMHVPYRILDQYELSADCVMDGEVLFISSSVQQWLVSNSVKDVQAPVMVGESDWFDDFGFARPGYNVTHGDDEWTRYIRVENDLSSLPTTGDWRSAWRSWWEQAKVTKSNYAYYNSGSSSSGVTKTITDKNARTGWVKRSELGNDAVVIATLYNDPSVATMFFYDAGARLGNGKVTSHKRAGIFMRTSGNWNSTESFSYTKNGYAQLEYGIRWMLSEFDGRPIIVK